MGRKTGNIVNEKVSGVYGSGIICTCFLNIVQLIAGTNKDGPYHKHNFIIALHYKRPDTIVQRTDAMCVIERTCRVSKIFQ